MTLSTGHEAATDLSAPPSAGSPRSNFATLRWIAISLLTESVLLAAFFLFPFGHVWGQMPPPASADGVVGGPAGDWSSALAVALIVGLPSLVPEKPVLLDIIVLMSGKLRGWRGGQRAALATYTAGR